MNRFWCQEGDFQGEEGIPLLQNADETIFFVKSSVEEARNLSTRQDLFVDFSGLQIK